MVQCLLKYLLIASYMVSVVTFDSFDIKTILIVLILGYNACRPCNVCFFYENKIMINEMKKKERYCMLRIGPCMKKT